MKILEIFKRLFNEAEAPAERLRRRVSDELARSSLPGFGNLSSLKDFFWFSLSRARTSGEDAEIPKTGVKSSFPIICNPYSRRSVRYLRWPEKVEKRYSGPDLEVMKIAIVPVVPVSTGTHDRNFRGLEIRPVVNDDEKIGLFAPILSEEDEKALASDSSGTSGSSGAPVSFL